MSYRHASCMNTNCLLPCSYSRSSAAASARCAALLERGVLGAHVPLGKVGQGGGTIDTRSSHRVLYVDAEYSKHDSQKISVKRNIASKNLANSFECRESRLSCVRADACRDVLSRLPGRFFVNFEVSPVPFESGQGHFNDSIICRKAASVEL